jgi:hypothetical protein
MVNNIITTTIITIIDIIPIVNPIIFNILAVLAFELPCIMNPCSKLSLALHDKITAGIPSF